MFLANVPYRPGVVLPTGTCTWRVNGRDFSGTAAFFTCPDHGGEFFAAGTCPETGCTKPLERREVYPANEPWDGFNAGSAASGVLLTDPWLARLEVSAGAVTAVRQATYQTVPTATSPSAAPPLECDNDNDGVMDGVWIAGTPSFLAPRRSPRGGVISQRVSYLVLDLDGRLNVNAVGMTAQSANSTPSGSPADVPLGMGYGPADIGASTTGTQLFAQLFGAGTWSGMLTGGTSTRGGATESQRRPPPGIGRFDGRYGPNGVPGATGDDGGLLQVTTATGSVYSTVVAGTNALADVKGQARLFMSGNVTGTMSTLTGTLTLAVPTNDADTVDDPYESRLDPARSVNDDLPFTLGELERVLRSNDPDAAFLAQRLAAALGTTAQASRLLITTDSWDTPGLTGPAANRVESALGTRPPSYPWASENAWSPDVAAGLRFNINRPVLSGTTPQAMTQQQEYCKGLYTLVRTLGESNARRAAQWAANVLDFRDEDSTMTRFVYDTNLDDGWAVTGVTTGTVWGVERPELLIADTAAWRNSLSGSAAMFASVVRAPFNARRVTSAGTTQAELPDPILRVSGTDRVNARAVAGTSSVWQLRVPISGTDRAVAFRPVTGNASLPQFILVNGTVTGTTTQIVGGSGGVGGASGLAGSGRESMVVIAGATAATVVSSASPPQMLVDQGGTFAPATTAVSGTLRLERLADPSRDNADTNPYIVVDMAPFTVSTSGDTADEGITQRHRRPGPRDAGGGHPLTAFWRQSPTWQIDDKLFRPYHETAGMVASGNTDPVPWFHWPNRPFVSQAELALVPADDADSLLANYSFPTTSLVHGSIGRLILDATIVPSRFAGVSITATGNGLTSLQPVGLDLLGQVGQLSTGREPGKMNVNTMPNGPLASNDALFWQMLVGGTQTVLTSGTLTTNPFTGTAQPLCAARSTAQLLSLSGTANQPLALEQVPTSVASGSVPPRGKNPFFAIATANRLASAATVRSNVFAVWITVETTDSSPGAPPPVTRRLFAIIDRSVPVGYSQGEDLNVRDTIRLLRYLD
ncbi:MAG: hypothetical protein ACK6CT_09835 [Planctomycetia bacterium]